MATLTADELLDIRYVIGDDLAAAGEQELTDAMIQAQYDQAAKDVPSADLLLPYTYVYCLRRMWGRMRRKVDRVTRFDHQDKTAEETARAACRPYLTSVPKFFAARKQLQYNDAGIDGVVTSRITRDDGPATASRDGVLFYGIAFRLTVTYNKDW